MSGSLTDLRKLIDKAVKAEEVALRKSRHMWWCCSLHGRICEAGNEFVCANRQVHADGCRREQRLMSGKNAPLRVTEEIVEGPCRPSGYYESWTHGKLGFPIKEEEP